MTFLCIGDVDVDLLASVSRLPALDDKVAGRRLGLTVGGMAANVAVGLARLGAPTRLAAALGDDDHGAFAARELAREGVAADYLIRLTDTATFMSVVLLTESGEKALVRLETEAYLPRSIDIPDSAFADVSHVHLTLGCIALSRDCATRAKAVNATVSLDMEAADLPPDADLDAVRQILQQTDWLLINQRSHQHALARLGESSLAAAKRTIITLGANGCRLCASDNASAVELPGYSVNVRDSTGAGDAFAAAFLYYHLALNVNVGEALRRANAAAALSVQHVGAQTGLADNAAVEAFLRDRDRATGG